MGYIRLIDIGIDALNPVQVFAKDMDIRYLREKTGTDYGKKTS